MFVRNLRPFAVEIPDVGVIDANDTIEVEDGLGASLCEQTDNWAEAKAEAKSKKHPAAAGEED